MFASLSASSDRIDDTCRDHGRARVPGGLDDRGEIQRDQVGHAQQQAGVLGLHPLGPLRRSRSRRCVVTARGAARRATPPGGATGDRTLPRRSPPRSRCGSARSPPARAPVRSRRSSDPPSAAQRSGRARGPSRARAWVPGVRRRRTRGGRRGSHARSSSASRPCTQTPWRPRPPVGAPADTRAAPRSGAGSGRRAGRRTHRPDEVGAISLTGRS